MTSVSLEVRDRADALIATLDQPFDVRFISEVSEPGVAEFTIPHDSPVVAANPSILDEGNWLHVVVGGNDFGPPYRIRPAARSRGDTWDAVQVRGLGGLTLFGECVVEADKGFDAQLVSDTRMAHFSVNDYPQSTEPGWTTPTFFGTQDAPTIARLQGFPEGWPPAGTGANRAEWMGPRALDGSGNHPVGVWYAHRQFTIPDNTGARIFFTCDGFGDLWIDGKKVFELREHGAWRRAYWADLEMPPETYTVGMRIENRTFLDATYTQNPSLALMSIHRVNEDGTLSTPLRRTAPGVGWTVQDYPSTPPGMTAGLIAQIFHDEADTRGCVSTQADRGFTAALDSDGVAWPDRLEFGFQAGNDSVLTALNRLAETGVDWAAVRSPTVGTPIRLEGYAKRGSDLSATVALTTSHVAELSQEWEGDVANTLVVRTQDGWRIFPAVPPVSGRRELFLSYGGSPSGASVEPWADETLDVYDAQRTAVEVSWPDSLGPQPTVDFDVGDVITVPYLTSRTAASWSTGPMRAARIAGRVNEVGTIDWTGRFVEAGMG